MLLQFSENGFKEERLSKQGFGFLSLEEYMSGALVITSFAISYVALLVIMGLTADYLYHRK
jgi:hypothetical protein